MIDLGPEEYLWRNHWVFIRKEELKVEHATLERSFTGTSNFDIEMSAVGL